MINSIIDYIYGLLPTRTEFEIGSAVAIMGTCISHLAGGYSTGLEVLLIIMVADYITGLTKVMVNKKLQLSSTKGFIGITKKLGMIIAIVIAFQIDRLDWITLGVDDPYIRNAFIYFFICNETISVLENLVQIGVPIPQFLPAFLKEYMAKISQEKIVRSAKIEAKEKKDNVK